MRGEQVINKLSIKDEICDKIVEKKSNLLSLRSLYGKREERITKELYSVFDPWRFKNINYPGLFGWNEFKSDKSIQLKNGRAIIEVKKVTEKSEYGYWHALIQSLLYQFQEEENAKKVDLCFLCFILDWGRKSGTQLNDKEKKFLSQYIDQNIYYVRINMRSPLFIEHNLKDRWILINGD